jgi:hypothetical protein
MSDVICERDAFFAGELHHLLDTFSLVQQL